MKKILSSLFFIVIVFGAMAQQQSYTPTKSNLKAREWFQNNKFGMFIHWGLYSIMGDGEWGMNNKNIQVKDYAKLEQSFNPQGFNAHDWVAQAKRAGMKYITLVTRHHDGFSMWDTKYSDFNIMHTPYHKDIVKQIAAECHKQGLKIFFYYSLLDWRRIDYSYWTGRTGKGTGRTERGNWLHYIQFMKNQLTELLTNYGKVGGIWFDGYWDQMAEESKDRKDTTFIDWHMREIYDLIHKLQPQCLIGNNHHMTPLPGEDFQMFERDIPGQNAHGLSFQKVSPLALETCATLNNSWGYNSKDKHYKTLKAFVALLVKAAGSNANLLMNIGPKADGKIPQPFLNKLDSMGVWMNTYGQSIYGTRGGYLPLQNWGALTQKKGKVYVHVLDGKTNEITLKDFPFKKIKKAYYLKTGKPAMIYTNTSKQSSLSVSFKKIEFKKNRNTRLTIKDIPSPTASNPDVVIVLEVK